MPPNGGIFSKETKEGCKWRTFENTQALLYKRRHEEKEEKMFCYLGEKMVNQNEQRDVFFRCLSGFIGPGLGTSKSGL